MGRKEFEEWLKKQKKSNSEKPYAEGSITVYLSAIATVSKLGNTYATKRLAYSIK